MYEKKREELAETISTTLSPLYISQVKNLHKKAIDSYKKELHARLKSDSYDFSDVVKESSTHHLDTFVEQAREITLAGTAWSYVETLEQLKLDMEGVSAECRSDELSKIITQLEVGERVRRGDMSLHACSARYRRRRVSSSKCV